MLKFQLLCIRIRCFLHSVIRRVIKPRIISASDIDVDFSLKDGIFHIKNKTDKYISINNLSFYYSNEISELSKDISVSPYGEIRVFSLRDFNIDSDDLKFSSVSRDYARNKNVRYGMALKYMVHDISKEKTLLTLKDYNLMELTSQK